MDDWWKMLQCGDWRSAKCGGSAEGAIGTESAITTGMSQADELQNRTTKFAIETVRFCRTIPSELENQRIKLQLISAATSVGANYRAARRARSHAEFTAKIGVVSEEADESEYWLSLVLALSLGSIETATTLHNESVELMKIFGKSAGTARGNRPE